MSIDDLNLIFVDVEATGKTPINGVMAEFGAVHYQTRKTFHGLLHDSIPDPDNPAKRVITHHRSRNIRWAIMEDFADWCTRFQPGRPIFVSDNNGYDAMWIACAFDELDLDNPFGHSSRRISDFYAGLVGDFTQTQAWKKWRVTPHTHHPIDDARGNAEAFATMLERFSGAGLGPRPNALQPPA